jgi:tetrahydromethanopterin S-methyltransferase subunit D
MTYSIFAYGVFVLAACLASYSLGDSIATFRARKRAVDRELNAIRNIRAR